MQLATNIATAFSILTPGQRRRWMLQLPFGMLASCVEAVTVAVVYALLASIGDGAGGPRLPQMLERFLPAATTGSGQVFLGLALALLLLRVLLSYADIAYSSRVLARDQAHFAARLYRGYLSLPFSTQVQRNSADHLHRLGESIGAVYGVILTELTAAVRTLATMAATLAVLVSVHPRVTLAIAVGGALLLLLTMKSLQGFNRRLGRRADDAQRLRHRSLHEGMESARDIYILGRQRFFAERFRRAEEEVARVRFIRQLLRATPRLIVETAVGAVIILVAAAGQAGPTVGGGLLPALGLYLYAGLRILPGLANLLVSAGMVEDATVPLQRLAADVAAMPEDKTTPAPWKLEHEISVDHVTFRYGAHHALDDITLRIAAGEILGVAGPNGAGKSTLLHVLMGLLPPDTGCVRVDGRDVREDPDAWRAAIGYVPQAIRLLDESIRANILFGFEAGRFDDDHLHQTVREAGLDRDIRSFAEGLERNVGQAGGRLSGGQRQRVALARGLYAGAAVLVLDEVTSALDTEARAAVDTILATARGRRSVILSTHDRDLLMKCDRVLYLDHGAVAGLDTPAMLAATCPAFASILSRPPEMEARSSAAGG